MAIEIRFNCSEEKEDYLVVHSNEESVILSGYQDDQLVEYVFDIPTAIKLSKTIRTHINKVKEYNG